jgi:signal transduction histidine kinase
MGVEIRTATGAADGQPRDYIASYWPVKDDAGTVQGINIAVLDITERKAAEAALARANAGLEREVAARTADLAAANAQLEAFAYSVSHDLRAPLRGMEGFGRILLDDFGGALGPRGARYAERIVAAAGRMETLINDLLTFSRLQRAEVSLRVLDPLPIFQRAAEEAMTGLEPGKADITLPANMPAVAAEPTVLAQAARNLLTNAVKFRRPGEPARVTVWAERLDGRVRIHVDDQGIGVAPEHRERIFGAFERLHGQESYPGTGIGLAIVRAAAERLGGQVGVADGPGGGARFFIELAAADAPGGTAGYRPMAATGEQGIA